MALTLRILALAAFGYLALVGLLWLSQTRMLFLSVRAPLPDPRAAGAPRGQRITVTTTDHVRLRGWFLPAEGAGPAPALLWFYGNGENVTALAPLLVNLLPAGYALVALDYRSYGESDGAPSEAGLYRDAEAAWAFAAAQPEIDPTRIAVYGRSLGAAAALHLAAALPVRAVVLDSPFTSARAMARVHYPFFPSPLVRLRLDNLARVRQVEAPLLVLHGTEDQIAPIAMGRALAAAAPRAELVAIEGAGHNETYMDGRQYRDVMHRFLIAAARTERTPSVRGPSEGGSP